MLLDPALSAYAIGVFGKWSKNLLKLKKTPIKHSHIYINDSYISQDGPCQLMQQRAIFILPYKEATQSGVLYTLLAHAIVFIASNVEENASFLRENGLEQLIFNREDSSDCIRAIEYAQQQYETIAERMKVLAVDYRWSLIS